MGNIQLLFIINLTKHPKFLFSIETNVYNDRAIFSGKEAADGPTGHTSPAAQAHFQVGADLEAQGTSLY